MLKQRFGLHVCTRLVVEKAVWATDCPLRAAYPTMTGMPPVEFVESGLWRKRAPWFEKNHAVLVNVVTQMQNSHVVTLQRSSSVRFPRR